MVKQVGCDKIMFSSDNIYQIPVELAKYRSVITREEDLEKVLYKNTARVYQLDL